MIEFYNRKWNLKEKKGKREMIWMAGYRPDIARIYMLSQKIKANRLILSQSGQETATCQRTWF
jgi:hypothetical protein